MSNQVQPVIIVKKKGGHGGHHGGAWKVAYADFVTAMMAFFLVMWLVNQSPQVKAGVGGYFRDPIAGMDGGKGVLPGADSIGEPKPQAPITDADAEQKQLESVVAQIKLELDTNPTFQGLRDQIEFTVTPEGLRIDLIEKAESSFFDSGSAKLVGESEQLLAVIGKQLALLGHDLDLEGHTDSRQYSSSDGYSNWELSSDRANAARRIIERNGVDAGHVNSVRGLADRELRIPEDPTDARNRRVSILVRSPAMKKALAETRAAEAAKAPLVPTVTTTEDAAHPAAPGDAAHVAAEAAAALAPPAAAQH